MKFTPPSWQLKSKRCDCCNGQGALCFSTCPNCDYVVLICDEVGTIFSNPKDLTQAAYGAIDSPALCPNCGEIKLSYFRYSTSDEIRNFGFAADKYE